MFTEMEKNIQLTIKLEITNIEATKKVGLSLSQFKRYKKSYIDNNFVNHHKGTGNRNACKYSEEQIKLYVQAYINDSVSIIEKSNGARKARKIRVFNNNYNYKTNTNISYSAAKRFLNKNDIISPISRFNDTYHSNIALVNNKFKTNPGEEFQCDGSFGYRFPDDEFEVVAHVIVDHATSTLVGCYFAKGETNEGYIHAFRNTFVDFGIPKKTKSDGRTTFFNTQNPDALTVMGRILESFGIKHTITSNSNNKVENAHDPIRDYIFDQMLIEGVRTFKEANKLIKKYMHQYNIILSHSIPEDNVLMQMSTTEIDEKFTTIKKRVLSSRYTIMIDSIEYFVVLNNRLLQRKPKTTLSVCTTYEGKQYVLYGGNKYKLIEATIENLNQLTRVQGKIQKVITHKNGIDFNYDRNHYYLVDGIGAPVKLKHRDVITLSVIDEKIIKVRCSKGIYLVKCGKYIDKENIKIKIEKRKVIYQQVIKYAGSEFIIMDGNNERVCQKIGSSVELVVKGNEVLSAIIGGKTYLVIDRKVDPIKYKVPTSKYAAIKMFGEF